MARKSKVKPAVAPRKTKPAPKPKRQAKPPQTPASAPPRPSLSGQTQPTRLIREIKQDKIVKRQDMGDLTGLAKSIDERGGLLSPICITLDNQLIAGQRRLAAWALSKFRKEPIPVNVLDVDNILAGEWDENAK